MGAWYVAGDGEETKKGVISQKILKATISFICLRWLLKKESENKGC